MKHDTAGDPMTGVKWTRRTTDKIACELMRIPGHRERRFQPKVNIHSKAS